MHVLYLSQVFEVGNDPGSERHFYFCKYLVRHGHTATAVTSNVDYKRALPKYPGGRKTVVHRIEGVDVHYVYSYANFRKSFLKRFYYYLTYFFSTLKAGSRIRKPDAIYAVSTPLTVGFLGYCLSKIHRVPFVFEVTDVWPDAAVACGVVRNKALILMAHWLEMLCYRKAAHIVALTHGIRDNIIAKGIDPDKVSLITNGVDTTLFSRSDDGARDAWRKKHTYSDRFVCMYLGAHGAYNALWTIIDAARELNRKAEFLFVFVGDGDEKARLQEAAAQGNLRNVLFLPPIPRSESPGLLSSADVFLLPNRRGDFFVGNLPNKLFDFLASGRPIVVAGEGETADVIRKAGCGAVVEAENGDAMAQALQNIHALSKSERESMGKRGRDFVLAHYNREHLSRKFLDIVHQARSGSPYREPAV